MWYRVEVAGVRCYMSVNGASGLLHDLKGLRHGNLHNSHDNLHNVGRGDSHTDWGSGTQGCSPRDKPGNRFASGGNHSGARVPNSTKHNKHHTFKTCHSP